MSRYILVPVDALDTLVGRREKDSSGNDTETILGCIEAEMKLIEQGLVTALTPYDLGILLSATLKNTVTREHKLNDRLTSFLWGTMGAELRSKGVLKC